MACEGCRNQVTQALYAELEAFIDALPEKKGALISVLHKAQSLFGYFPGIWSSKLLFFFYNGS